MKDLITVHLFIKEALSLLFAFDSVHFSVHNIFHIYKVTHTYSFPVNFRSKLSTINNKKRCHFIMINVTADTK